MQSPVVVFDHLTKTVTVIPAGPQHKRLAEIAAAQHGQVATSGRPTP